MSLHLKTRIGSAFAYLILRALATTRCVLFSFAFDKRKRIKGLHAASYETSACIASHIRIGHLSHWKSESESFSVIRTLSLSEVVTLLVLLLFTEPSSNSLRLFLTSKMQ